MGFCFWAWQWWGGKNKCSLKFQKAYHSGSQNISSTSWVKKNYYIGGVIWWPWGCQKGWFSPSRRRTTFDVDTIQTSSLKSNNCYSRLSKLIRMYLPKLTRIWKVLINLFACTLFQCVSMPNQEKNVPTHAMTISQRRLRRKLIGCWMLSSSLRLNILNVYPQLWLCQRRMESCKYVSI